MAVHWSSESIVANHQDLQTNTMALDWKGEYALLAGRKTVAIVHLENPTEVRKRQSRMQQKYGVSAAEWNPTSFCGHRFVIGVGEKADIYSWHDGTLINEKGLKAHTRNITDLNWHKTEPHSLATCSIDTFIHIWDTRDVRKPSSSLSTITGASQVKWNKLNPYLLASAHDCDIRIWDQRKISQPVSYITAHLSKIHCIDWSPNQETCLVSSNDSTIKFFDMKNPKKSEVFINTHSPVWRARYTPFGDGIVTVVVPPLRRVDNSLLMWSVLDKTAPIHTFIGHSDVVLEFDWRMSYTNGNQSDYQLVTWSRDNSLRLWKIDPYLLKVCGHKCDDDDEVLVDDNISDSDTILGDSDCDKNMSQNELVLESGTDAEDNDLYKLDSDGLLDLKGEHSDRSNSNTGGGRAPPTSLPIAYDRSVYALNQSPMSCSSLNPDSSVGTSATSNTSGISSHNLQQEFTSVSALRESSSFASMVLISTDEEKRSCEVTAQFGNILAILCVNLPTNYPKVSQPVFKFLNGTSLDVVARAEILKQLKSTATQNLKRKKGCLESCLKNFISQVKILSRQEDRVPIAEVGMAGQPLNMSLYGGQQDYNIPFPRTSGARFSSGKLICFTRPTILRQGNLNARMPRSLSALRANIKTPIGVPEVASPMVNFIFTAIGQGLDKDKNISVSAFYGLDPVNDKAGSVLIFDISSLLPISKDIASSYTLNDDMLSTCSKNREAAATFGREDLVRLWTAAEFMVSTMKTINSETKEDFSLSYVSFSRNLITAQIDHYIKCYDVQTAAMLSCVFGEKPVSHHTTWRTRNENFGTAGGSPYKTIHGINTEGCDMHRVKHYRSNSEGSLAETPRSSISHSEQTLSDDASGSSEKPRMSILDPSKINQYNEIRRTYAEILYRWDLLEQRTMVMKYTENLSPVHTGVDFQMECCNCGQPSRHPTCGHCKKFAFICVICHLPVKGCSNFCIVCGHGGHTHHIADWFSENSQCPSGCGCDCLAAFEEVCN